MRHRLYKKLSFFCVTVLIAIAVLSPNTLAYGASDEGIVLDKSVAEVTDKNTVSSF